MPIKRSYSDHGDACLTAHAVELIGDRWTYPLVREMLLAPKRFGELAAAVVGITPAVLTTRLREMEASGLVERITLAPPASVSVYRLTPWAKELEPLLRDLGRWAHRGPVRSLSHDAGLTPDGAVQSMLTMAADPPSEDLEIQLELSDARTPKEPGYTYRLSWDRAGLRIERGEHPSPAATLRTDSTALAGMLYQAHGVLPGDDATHIDGDRAAVDLLLASFPDA